MLLVSVEPATLFIFTREILGINDAFIYRDYFRVIFVLAIYNF